MAASIDSDGTAQFGSMNLPQTRLLIVARINRLETLPAQWRNLLFLFDSADNIGAIRSVIGDSVDADRRLDSD
jgi:hypothetical protein